MTTMSPDDIDNGRLICELGIAPVKPTEFVIFRIQLKTLETLDRPTVREETHHATGHP